MEVSGSVIVQQPGDIQKVLLVLLMLTVFSAFSVGCEIFIVIIFSLFRLLLLLYLVFVAAVVDVGIRLSSDCILCDNTNVSFVVEAVVYR